GDRQGVGASLFGNGVDGGGVAVGVGDGGVGIELAAGVGAGDFAAITEIDGGADVGLSGIWVGGVDPDRSGQRGGNGSSLGVASGNGDDVKEAVGFETVSGGDIDLAVGDGLSDKMADGWQSVARAGLIRAIEQFERNGK